MDLTVDSLIARVVHVQGDLDAQNVAPRQGLRLRIGNKTLTVWGCVGVPPATLGQNGDYALRQDGAASAHLYFKASGAWGAIA